LAAQYTEGDTARVAGFPFKSSRNIMRFDLSVTVSQETLARMIVLIFILLS
jgi:hypothetical protein